MDMASGPQILAVWTDGEAGVTLPRQAGGQAVGWGRCDLAASGRAEWPDGQCQHLAQDPSVEPISASGEGLADPQLHDSHPPAGCTGPPRTWEQGPARRGEGRAAVQAPESENVAGSSPCPSRWKVERESPGIGPVGPGRVRERPGDTLASLARGPFRSHRPHFPPPPTPASSQARKWCFPPCWLYSLLLQTWN